MRPIRLLVLAMILVPWSAEADIIHLKRGKVEGIIVERAPDRLVVKTKVGKVTLDPADVVRIEHKATPLSLYHEMSAKTDAKDAAGHFALGLWCTEQKLFREARQEFEKTIALDPDHKGARERLGYVYRDGKWMTKAEAKRASGLVLHEGKWVTAEERDASVQRKASAAWQRRIRKAIGKGTGDPERIIARIHTVLGRKPEAAAIHAARLVLRDMVAEALEAKRDRTEDARIALVEVLAEHPSAEASGLLQRAAVQDGHELVRAAAIRALAKQKSVDNTAFFVGLIERFTGERYRVQGNKRTRIVARRVLRRAAIALAQLDDARAIPALAKALFVRFHIPEQGNDLPPMTMSLANPRSAGSTVVTDSHGNQMVMPVQEQTNWGLTNTEQPAVEDGFFFNESAYSALRKLTGQDFSTDKSAWLAWWHKNKHNLID
ncbi:MAG: hypothetical protein ISS72_01245 [Candidatus Brocadiae bacterium]|nr:hypothetical protein [Candidatus Brocadiia bacterium]